MIGLERNLVLALMCAVLTVPAAADDGIWVTQVNPTRAAVPMSDANRRSEFQASPSSWSYDASHAGGGNQSLQRGTLYPELDIRQSGMRNTVTPLLSAGSGRVRAEQTGSTNSMDVQQYGSNNQLTAVQTGSGNQMPLVQSGNGLELTATQVGQQNVMALQQSGNGNVIVAVQTGAQNVIGAIQGGSGNRLVAYQR